MDVEEITPGSLWRRWEPHTDRPGTVFNNQVKGEANHWRPVEGLWALRRLRRSCAGRIPVRCLTERG